MKRTALYIGFSYTAGLLAASVVHRQLWFWGAVVISLTALFIISYRRAVWKYVLISTLSFMTACCVYWGYDASSVQKQLAFEGKENTVFSGEITEISLHDSGYATYILEGRLNEEISANIMLLTDYQGYAYGDTLTVTGKPELLQSSYAFDSVSYYKSKNVFLSMPMDALICHTPRSHPTLRSTLYEWRMKMTSRIRSQADGESGALMTGMLFGDKSEMSSSTRTSLYRTGIGHVLAVSGLHLDFLALFVIRILRKAKADRRLSFGVLALLAVLFVLCVGETVSVKRACIMILISQSAGLFFRKADMLNTISIAMLILSAENPFVVHSAGFWLSFGGTFGIAVFAPYMTKHMKSETYLQKQMRSVAAMFCVFVVIFPVSALFFREMSLISPFANLLVVPLCMLILLLEAVSLLFGAQGIVAEFLLCAANFVSEAVLRISAYIANLPWAYAAADSEVLLCIVGSSVVLIAFCIVRFRNHRTTCIAIAVSFAAACMAAGTEWRYQNHSFHIAVLGEERDCTLVLRSGSDAVIVDMSGDSNASAYVQAYLQSSGVRTVESLFLCKPKAKSITRYEQTLRFCAPEHLILMQEPETENISIAGTNAVYAQHREILFHGAVVTVSADSAEVQYEDMRYLCTQEKNPEIGTCDVLTVYGTSKNVLPDCGILMVLDARTCYTADDHTYTGVNNLELALANDGKCRVRSLYGDT